PTAALPASALVTVGHDAHMPDFSRASVTPANKRSAVYDPATDAGADRDQHQVVGVVSGAIPEFTPCRGVGVVFNGYRHVDPRFDALCQGLIAPFDIRGEHDRRSGVIDKPRRTDTEPGDGFIAANPAGQLGHGRRDLFGIGCVDAVMAHNVSVGINKTGGDLGATDVNPDGR